MSFSYFKSLSTNFGNGLNLFQLTNELNFNSEIAKECLVIINVGDTVEIKFVSELSEIEETVLDNVISNHIPENSIPKDNFYIVYANNNLISSTSYFLCTSFKYDGSMKIGKINYFELVAYKEPEITSYSVRIVDSDTKLILVEKTGLTNNEINAQDLGEISNIPTSTTILELQIKRIGGNSRKNIHVNQLIVYYGN